LGNENDRAFALMATLDAAQRSQAILGYSVSDLVLGPGHDGQAIQPEGLRASALSASQQTMLMDLVREWTGIAHDAFAAPRMDEIRASLPQTYFAWSGPTTAGSAAYFPGCRPARIGSSSGMRTGRAIARTWPMRWCPRVLAWR
jgi:hypothetical protein